LEEDFAPGLRGTHLRLVSGPEALFAVFGLFAHVDLHQARQVRLAMTIERSAPIASNALGQRSQPATSIALPMRMSWTAEQADNAEQQQKDSGFRCG